MCGTAGGGARDGRTVVYVLSRRGVPRTKNMICNLAATCIPIHRNMKYVISRATARYARFVIIEYRAFDFERAAHAWSRHVNRTDARPGVICIDQSAKQSRSSGWERQPLRHAESVMPSLPSPFALS